MYCSDREVRRLRKRAVHCLHITESVTRDGLRAALEKLRQMLEQEADALEAEQVALRHQSNRRSGTRYE